MSDGIKIIPNNLVRLSGRRGGGLSVSGPLYDAYSSLVKSNNPASILSYLPLTESLGATTARDLSGNSRTGRYSHTQPGCVGPVTKSAFFDGHNSTVDWYSAGLASAFSGNAGTLAICARVVDAKMWTNGIARKLAQIYIDANNHIYFHLQGGGGLYLFCEAKFGGTNKAAFFGTISNPATNWFHVAVTWDKVADEVKIYLNGVQQGSTLTGLGTWTGAIPTDRMSIGSDQSLALGNSASPANAWHGFLAHAELRNVAMPQSYFAAQYALLNQAALPAYKHFAIVGDSIAWGLRGSGDIGWASLVRDWLVVDQSSLYLLNNFSTGGAKSADGVTYTTKLSADLTAADTALVALGMNDYTNSVAVATYKSNLTTIVTALKAFATDVYLLNVYPGGGDHTPVKGDYNTAAAEVSSEQSVPLIDVSTAYDPGVHCTVDGTHPDDGGHAILAGLVETALLS